MLLGATLLVPASPARAQEPTPLTHVGPTELLVCAPGRPGTAKQAQAIMDELAKQLTARAGWQPGRLTARYVATEKEGLEAIAKRPAWLLTTTEFYCKHVKAIDGELIAATQLKEGMGERFTLLVPATTSTDDASAALRGRALYGTRLLDPVFATRVALRNTLSLEELCDVQRQKRTLRAVKKATAEPATSALWLSHAEHALLQTPRHTQRLADWKPLLVTQPVPSAPLLALNGRANGGPDDIRVPQLKQALYALNSTDEGKALCTKMHMLGFAKPDAATYAAAVQLYHPKNDGEDGEDNHGTTDDAGRDG